jgi:hypothetical protein
MVYPVRVAVLSDANPDKVYPVRVAVLSDANPDKVSQSSIKSGLGWLPYPELPG